MLTRTNRTVHGLCGGYSSRLTESSVATKVTRRPGPSALRIALTIFPAHLRVCQALRSTRSDCFVARGTSESQCANTVGSTSIPIMFDRLSEDIIKKRMAGGDGDRNDRKIAFYCVHVLLRNNPLSHSVNQG